jgi:hypothetical protein
MSVDFTQPASSASIPDASESVKGKIRIATSAEATAGTDDLTAMTPLKVQSVVNTALVGGVTYQGTFDASSPADLSNASKGDLYIISVAGSYQGQSWAVGDHLLINADMGGTLDPAKIDKVDNTDAVTSVAGRTGAITLSTADVSGLATVASTGAYSDLSGTPTLGTAAAEDVGTSAGNVVQLDGSAKLPAVDGSQLTNLPAPTMGLNDLTDVTFTAGSGIDDFVLTYNNGTGRWGAEIRKSFYMQPYGSTATAAQIVDNRSMYYELSASGITLTIPTPSGYAVGGLVIVRNTSAGSSSITGPSMMLSDGSVVTTVSLDADDVKIFVWRSISPARLHEISTSRLSQIDDIDLTGLANGDVLIYNSTSGKWEAGSTPATSVALDDLTDVTITGAATGEVLRYNGAEWVDAQLAYSDLSGAPTNVSSFTNDAGYISDITAESLGDLADVDLTGLADGEIIIYNSTSGKWEANPPPAPLATTTSVGLIEIAENAEATAGTATDKALVPSNISSITTAQLDNSAGTMLESANNLSELTNAATARTNLGLATVASTGAYSDLSGTPTLGTAAALDVGTAANNVVQLNGSAQLPAVDGSLLTGVVADISGASIGDLIDVTITAAATGEVLRYDGAAWVDAQLSLDDLSDVDLTTPPTNNQTLVYDASAGKFKAGSAATPAVVTNTTTAITTYTGHEEAHVITPTADGSVTLPDASLCGAGYKYYIKNMSTFTLSVTPTNGLIDGLSYFDLSSQYSAITIFTDGTDWYIF